MKIMLLLFALALGATSSHAMEQENTVGVQQGLLGQKVKSRADNTGAGIISDGHGHFNEVVKQGNVYTLLAKTVTVIATCDIAPLPAAGCPIAGILNPNGNNKAYSILKVGCATVSGTPGGPFYLDVIPFPTGITIATSAAITNDYTFRQGGNTAIGFSGSAAGGDGMTGSVLATTLRPLGGQAAIAAGAGNYHVDDLTDGSIIVPPGAFLGISAHAVGTTHIASCYITWEEIAYP